MIASGAPAWAVWVALGLWGVALVVLAVAFLLARRLWSQWQPMLAQVQPMLQAMFAPQTYTMSGAERVASVGERVEIFDQDDDELA